MATNTIYRDVNSLFGQDGKGVILTDLDAVQIKIYNTLSCVSGSRPFLRSFGSGYRELLFDPATQETADDLAEYTYIAIETWVPEVEVLPRQSSIIAVPDRNGYYAKWVYNVPNLSQTSQFSSFLHRLTGGN